MDLDLNEIVVLAAIGSGKPKDWLTSLAANLANSPKFDEAVALTTVYNLQKRNFVVFSEGLYNLTSKGREALSHAPDTIQVLWDAVQVTLEVQDVR